MCKHKIKLHDNKGGSGGDTENKYIYYYNYMFLLITKELLARFFVVEFFVLHIPHTMMVIIYL